MDPTITQTQFTDLIAHINSVLVYQKQIYNAIIIIASIMLGIFILSMFYKLLACFGK